MKFTITILRYGKMVATGAVQVDNVGTANMIEETINAAGLVRVHLQAQTDDEADKKLDLERPDRFDVT